MRQGVSKGFVVIVSIAPKRQAGERRRQGGPLSNGRWAALYFQGLQRCEAVQRCINMQGLEC